MRGLDRTVLQVLGRSAGGIARHVADIAKELDGAAGLRVAVACPADLPIAMPVATHEVAIPNGPLKGHFSATRVLRKLIEDVGCDVVHAHGLRAGIDAGLAARNLDVPVLLTVHNLVQPEVAGRFKAPLYRKAEAIAVRSSDHVFCVSEQIARHLRSSVPRCAEKIEVLYLGVEEPKPPTRTPAEIRRELGVGDGAPLIVSLSRLSAQKAVHVLLEALVSLGSATLAVLGEGPRESELKELARGLGVADRTTFLGFRADAGDYLAAADAFCLSSIWEGVPLAAQEAILLGTPVVATDVGGMSELITDRRSGRLCPPEDPAALASGLAEVLNDRELARGYAAQARIDLERRFSRSRMFDRLVDIYKDGIRAS